MMNTLISSKIEGVLSRSEMKRTLFGFVILTLQITGCEREKESQGYFDNDQIYQTENQILISPNAQLVDTVKFVEEAVFESGDEIYMEGHIRSLAVDDKGQIFIASTRPGFVGIYVFRSDGSYKTNLSRHGRGPAEYESISSISMVGEKLYVFDQRIQKIGIFSIEGLNHVRDILLDYSQLQVRGLAFSEGMNTNKMIVRSDGTFLMRLRSRPRNDPSYNHKDVFITADESGKLIPSKYLQVDSHTPYFPDEQLSLPFTGAFSRSSLVAADNNGKLYTNWTEDFIINVHNSEGELEKSYKHKIQNASLNLDDLNIDRNMKNTLNKYELPSTWPAVHTMVFDDEERLWVATITESESDFTWYVLNAEGELIARFTKPGKRTERTVVRAPLIVIKDGYFYSHERDLRQGFDRIVKHKIEFIER